MKLDRFGSIMEVNGLVEISNFHFNFEGDPFDASMMADLVCEKVREGILRQFSKNPYTEDSAPTPEPRDG